MDSHVLAAASQVVVLSIFVIAAAVWVGGFATLVVVRRVSNATLPPPQRVLLFRGLGRTFGPVSGIALTVALLSGAVLLSGQQWDWRVTLTCALAAALVGTTALGVVQARRMTERRVEHLRHPHDEHQAERVRRGARATTALRAAIGVLTLALVISGALLSI